MRSRLSSAYMRHAAHNCRLLFKHWKAATVGLDLATDAKSVEANSARIPNTMKSSTSVKPALEACSPVSASISKVAFISQTRRSYLFKMQQPDRISGHR